MGHCSGLSGLLLKSSYNDYKGIINYDEIIPACLSQLITTNVAVIGLVSAIIIRKRRTKVLPISSSFSDVSRQNVRRLHSFGSVSSAQSVLTDPEVICLIILSQLMTLFQFRDISSSLETICADRFLTSLEDE